MPGDWAFIAWHLSGTQTVNRIFAMGLALFCAFAGAAHAQPRASGFSDLMVLPSPASSGQNLHANVFFQECLNLEVPVESTVVVAGQVVTLTVTMFPAKLTFCGGVSLPPYRVGFNIGSLPPGEYTLVLESISTYPGVTYLPLTTTFTVGPAASPIVTTSKSSLAALALMLLLLAWYRMAARRTDGRAVP